MANGCRLLLQIFDQTRPGQSQRPLVRQLGVPKHSVSRLFSEYCRQCNLVHHPTSEDSGDVEEVTADYLMRLCQMVPHLVITAALKATRQGEKRQGIEQACACQENLGFG